jgi:hypothetical protein
VEAPAVTQPPVPPTHYDLYPWPSSSSSTPPPPPTEPPAPPTIERQGSRARLSLRRSLSATSLLVRLEDVINAARPLLQDPCASYRLVRGAPMLLLEEEEEEEEEEEGGRMVQGEEVVDAMYASAFAHLLALCRILPPGSRSSSTPQLLDEQPQQQQQQQQQQQPTPQQGQASSSMLGVALQIVQGLLQSSPPGRRRRSPALPRHAAAFLARCLLLSPLETIAGCRHLGIWSLLLGEVGLAPPSPAAAAAAPAPAPAAPAMVAGEEGAAWPWLHAQDLCLELLHWAFLAAQRPPTTNFLSSPTREMGLVAGLLEAAVGGLQEEAEVGDPQHSQRPLPLLLVAFRACRWLDLLIREQDDPSAAATGLPSAAIPAFNEHGHRLLALLPRLVSHLPSSSSFSSSDPGSGLVWPVRHAALSLLASLVHVASLLEAQLALTSRAAEALFFCRYPPPEDEGTEPMATRPLDPIIAEVALGESRPAALFILTRALHIGAQMALASPLGDRVGDAAVLRLYAGYLARFRACAAAAVAATAAGSGEGEAAAAATAAAIDTARALCVLLREHEAYSPRVVRFHQWALRRAGAFHVVGEVLAAAAAAASPALANQCLALLTALVGAGDDNGNAAAPNTRALAAAFLQPHAEGKDKEEEEQEEEEQPPQPRLLRLLLLCPAALHGPDGADTVRALFDLAVGGPFPVATDGASDVDGSDARGGGGVGAGVVVRSPGVVSLLFRLLPHLPAELQVMRRLGSIRGLG